MLSTNTYVYMNNFHLVYNWSTSNSSRISACSALTTSSNESQLVTDHIGLSYSKAHIITNVSPLSVVH